MFKKLSTIPVHCIGLTLIAMEVSIIVQRMILDMSASVIDTILDT